MKKLVKRLAFAAILTSGLSLFSCEKNDVLPDRFADDPPTTNTPQKPPKP